MTQAVRICPADNIPDNGARGFSVTVSGGAVLDIFVIRKDNHYYGYVNSCPHTGVNLEWQTDDFLDTDNKLIQCSTHGARFRIDDGFCVYGPCNGQYLSTVPLSLRNGMLYLSGE